MDEALVERRDERALSFVLEQLEVHIIENLPLTPPALDPVAELKIKDLDFIELHRTQQSLHQQLRASPCFACNHFSSQALT